MGQEWVALMNLWELTEAMETFVREQGWYEEHSPRPQTARNLAVSLAVEAVEVLEHFQWTQEASDTSALGSELADVLLYLLQLARVAGIDLEQATLAKLAENQGRHW